MKGHNNYSGSFLNLNDYNYKLLSINIIVLFNYYNVLVEKVVDYFDDPPLCPTKSILYLCSPFPGGGVHPSWSDTHTQQ